MDSPDLLKDNKIEPPLVFEPNREYINKARDNQVNLRSYHMEFVSEDKSPCDWKSFGYQSKLNAGGTPSEIVENATESAAKTLFRLSGERW
jgi:hypothetical protein